MSQYRLHRSISGPRIYPCHSRYFHSMGRIVSYCSATHPSRTTIPRIRIFGIVVREGCVALQYYWCDSFLCCRVSPQTLRSFWSTSSASIRQWSSFHRRSNSRISPPCWCQTLSYTSLLKRRECYSGEIQQRNQSTLTCSDIWESIFNWLQKIITIRTKNS